MSGRPNERDWTVVRTDGAIALAWSDEPYVPSEPVPGAVEAWQRRGRMLFDGLLVRVARLDHALHLQPVRYFDVLATNLAPGPAGALRPLGVLADPLGLNAIVLTSDDRMIVQRRSARVLLRPGALCPGVSGSVEPRDVQVALARGGTLADLPVDRELYEELSVAADEVASVRCLGITRELARRGTPEAFYEVRLGLSADEVLARRPPEPEGQVIAVEDPAQLEGLGAPVSVPLRAALILRSTRPAPGGRVRGPGA